MDGHSGLKKNPKYSRRIACSRNRVRKTTGRNSAVSMVTLYCKVICTVNCSFRHCEGGSQTVRHTCYASTPTKNYRVYF